MKHHLVTGQELLDLAPQLVPGVDPSLVNASSIDLTIADLFLLERSDTSHTVDLSTSSTDLFTEFTGSFITLQPGEFILAHTEQYLQIPDNVSAQLTLRSSVARMGVNHLLAGWVDPGFRGTLTLELQNTLRRHSVRIPAGIRIGQISVFRHDAVVYEMSYASRGRYLEQMIPTASKGAA